MFLLPCHELSIKRDTYLRSRNLPCTPEAHTAVAVSLYLLHLGPAIALVDKFSMNEQIKSKLYIVTRFWLSESLHPLYQRFFLKNEHVEFEILHYTQSPFQVWDTECIPVCSWTLGPGLYSPPEIAINSKVMCRPSEGSYDVWSDCHNFSVFLPKEMVTLITL